MKIYNKIIMDFSGNVIYEDSYEYSGTIIHCKGGQDKAQRAAQKAADRSYALQLQQMEEQKAQLAEMKRMQSEEELQKRIFAEKSLQRKRKGSLSTILTGDIGTPKIAKKSIYA